MYLKQFFLIILFSFSVIYAEQTSSQKFSHHLSIGCYLDKTDESLQEWIDYHRLIGVEYFYIYDSSNSQKNLETLTPYINNGVVEFTRWMVVENESCEIDQKSAFFVNRLSAYENLIFNLKSKNQTEWLAILDANEFLVPCQHKNMRHLLKDYKEDVAIRIKTSCYSPDELLKLENAFLTKNNRLGKKIQVEKYQEVTKNIFKPSACLGFSLEPYDCLLKEGFVFKEIGFSKCRINKYDQSKQNINYTKRKNSLYIDLDDPFFTEKIDHLIENYDVYEKNNPISSFTAELEKQNWKK